MAQDAGDGRIVSYFSPFPSAPEAFQAHLKAEIAKWKKVIEDAKIPKQ